MADAAIDISKSQSKKDVQTLQAMRLLVAGRIENSRLHEGKRYTHVMTPAADAYSRPQLVEIRSKSKLGDRGEEVAIHCLLGGYQRKAYQVKDKNTGEIVTVVPVEHTLDLVEAE
ncbi:single-stranded DNA-binding protein [Undibacterium sp. Di27W]|uniref:single-stranded DNA-binding protein n=1 Tax=Undibacterium sp. Di27W TaxID=3413036 RepID=UPI003BEF529D